MRAGADPNRPLPRDDGDPPWPAVYAAIQSGCPPNYWNCCWTVAPTRTRPAHWAAATSPPCCAATGPATTPPIPSGFVACLHADRAGARRQLARDPGLVGRLTEAERGAIVHAAETGNTAGLVLMLDLGFPIEIRGGDHGGTPLHVAAYSGSAEAVRLLLDRGADMEARDTTWDDTPLGWAIVGSGERPKTNPDPNWIATTQTLIEARASTVGVTLSPDDPKPPSPQVAELLRGYGIGDQ